MGESHETWAVLLGRNPVFGSLSLAARERLAQRGSVLELARGARLFSRGDPADAAYLVLSGELEIGLSQASGEQVWLTHAGPGMLVGDVAVLDGGGRSADVAAARRSRLLSLGRGALLEAFEAEPQAALRLVAFALERLRATNARLEQTTSLDVEARLARLLLAEAQPNTRSQSDLAAMVGATRETVNRRLARWRAGQMIELTRRGLVIVDAGRLMRVAREGRASGGPGQDGEGTRAAGAKPSIRAKADGKEG